MLAREQDSGDQDDRREAASPDGEHLRPIEMVEVHLPLHRPSKRWALGPQERQVGSEGLIPG